MSTKLCSVNIAMILIHNTKCHARADVVGGCYTHLKGSNNQWCAKYFIEYPSTQSASSFLTPAMKYTMKICQKQFTFTVSS